jgi:hypothetical protein
VRPTISLVASLGLLLAVALPASAAVEAGPKCADIDNLLGNYDGIDGGTNADDPDEFGIILKAPSCPRYSYTIYVFNETSSAEPFFSRTWTGDGTTIFQATFQVTSAEDTDQADTPSPPGGDIYIYAESWFVTGGGNKVVLDRAPDTGFALATIDGVTPGSTIKAG